MAPEKAPAFQFYPKDFLTDGHVAGMSLTERGAYITLISLCWLERSLPADVNRLARLVRVSDSQMSRLWPALEPCFRVHPSDPTRLVHPRLEHERAKQDTFRQRQSDKGRTGASNRWIAQASPDDGTGIAQASPNDGRGIAGAWPDDGSSISVLRKEKQKTVSLRPPKEPADGRVKEFLTWFQSEYKTRRHGADYLVKWDRDGPLVKQMLGATALPRLQKLAQILLSDKTDEAFIAETDRGVGILSVKFNWLSERLAAWEARQKAVSA